MNVHLEKAIKNALFISWFLISITIFIIFNRTSYIHFFVFPSWSIFFEHIVHLPLLKYLFDIFLSLIGVIIFSLICMGVGLSIMEKITSQPIAKLTLGITAFIVGEILFSFFFLFVISVSQMLPALTIITMLVSFGIGINPLKRYFQSLDKDLSTIRTLNKWDAAILILAIGVIFLSLMLSSSRLGYDAVSDYFSQAKIMAVSHVSTSFFPGNNMIVSSLHPDILFTAIIQLFGDQSARMFSLVNGISILLMGCAIAEESGYLIRSRIYFVVLLVTSTAFTDLLGDGKVELICTAPIVATIYWLLYSLKHPERNIFLLLGLLTGFAIISRLYNIFLVPVFVMIFYLIHFAKTIFLEKHKGISYNVNEKGKSLLSTLWMLPTIVIILIFHLWLNQQWLGSLFAPLKFRQNLAASNWEWQFNPAKLYLLRILYPFTISFFNTPQSLGNISPLFIGFMPFLSIKNIRTKILIPDGLSSLLVSTVFTLVTWIWLFYTVVEIRYVFFLWLVIFLLAGQWIELSLNALPALLRKFFQFTIIALLSFISLRTISISISTYSPGQKNETFECQDIDFCTFFNIVNQVAKPGDRILALNAYRYYFRPDLFACSSRANEYVSLQDLAKRNPSGFWAEVYRQGYSFVVYENNFSVSHSGFGAIPSPELAPQWLKVRIISSSDSQNNISYMIEADNPPFTPKVSCNQNYDQSIWQLTYLP